MFRHWYKILIVVIILYFLLDYIMHLIQEYTIHTKINTDLRNYNVNEQKEKERLIALNETLKSNNYRLNLINTINICITATVLIVSIYNICSRKN